MQYLSALEKLFVIVRGMSGGVLPRAAGAAAARQYSPQAYYRDFVALVHTVLQKGAAL